MLESLLRTLLRRRVVARLPWCAPQLRDYRSLLQQASFDSARVMMSATDEEKEKVNGREFRSQWHCRVRFGCDSAANLNRVMPVARETF